MAVVASAAASAPEPADAKRSKGGGSAGARQFLPPDGKLYAGISDTGQTSDFREYRIQTQAHPAVMQAFESWGYMPKEAINRWHKTNTRGMISLSSGCDGCQGSISNRSIAKGKGDRYIVALAKTLKKHNDPTYIRLLPEMNGHWNAYSAFKRNGKPRGDAYSTANFRRAWKRFVLIVRGGKRASIDRRLLKLGMPGLQARTKPKLASPKVAIAWVPQSQGSPNVPGNQPADYFPGYRYLDWVGADTFSLYPSLQGIRRIYREYDKAPFMVGEWAAWLRDDRRHVHDLFNWVEQRGRARMIVYYQGFGEGDDNDFEISDYPDSRKALTRRLNSNRFLPFAPEAAREKTGKQKSADR